MNPRAYVIVNRRAHRLRDASPLLDQCRARATLQTLETYSLTELDEAAQQIARAPAPVVLAGGDGSHGAGLTALARAFGSRPLPPIALLAGGTVNTVAKGWGMKTGVAAARRLLDAVDAGTAVSTRRPTLCVRERLLRVASSGRESKVQVQVAERGALDLAPVVDERGPERLGFIVGAGLVSRFFSVYEERGAGGLGTAAKIVARVFAGSLVGGRMAKRVLTPGPCTLVVDDVPAPFDVISLFCASVVADVGLGLRLLYRAGEAEDRFHVVATPLGPSQLGPQMPRVLAGRPLRGPGVDTLARTVTLRFPPGTGAYVIDGELSRCNAISLTAGPVIDVLSV